MLVLLLHAICYAIAARLLRQPLPGFQGWSLPSRKPRGSRSGFFISLWNQLHPLTRRDLILLGRDRHFLLQMLVAPLIVAIVPQSSSPHHPSWILVMAFATGLLFLWSAILHILPMEGRSLWMLFTWPQSLAKFLWRRLRVLLTFAGCYTMLVLILSWKRYDSSEAWMEFWRLPYLALGLIGFGLLLTALAVLNYEPETIHGRERPRILLHYGMLIPAGIYGWLLQREGHEILWGLMVLALAAGLIWWRMMRRLPGLLDRPQARKKKLARAAFRLYLLKYMTR
jgi:hypothetical protein